MAPDRDEHTDTPGHALMRAAMARLIIDTAARTIALEYGIGHDRARALLLKAAALELDGR